MGHDLTFDKLLKYDVGVPGISIEVELRLGGSSVSVLAKVDTGSDHCVFSRASGEALGLEIDTGERQVFSTATGMFLTFGHRVTLIAAEYAFDSLVFSLQMTRCPVTSSADSVGSTA